MQLDGHSLQFHFDMTVYKKLMQARVALQKKALKKSGHNKFAGYSYFELADFLPETQTIFESIGLCGIVTFDREMATLTIVDADTGQEVKITSPMESATLKGCHPIQSLGAVETYQRRYLWATAMELVEHDALDAVTDSVEPTDWSQSLKDAGSLAELKDIFKSAWRATSGDTKSKIKAEYEALKSKFEEQS